MLRTISIRDVVLIDRLDLTFDTGLCVLTGETGAGKSILLDALGLALGERADARLVRHGADKAVVTAEFEVAADHPVHQQLSEHGLSNEDGPILLRRVLGTDGRSRAFINDQAVSISLLKQTGERLVEIHGQFENHRLLNPASHRDLLDAYGGLGSARADTGNAWRAWRGIIETRRKAEEDLEAARRDEDYLRHAVDELAALNPQPGEETALAEQRTMMMHGEKLVAAMNEAASELGHGRGVERNLRDALRHLEVVSEKAEGRLDAAIAALDQGAQNIADGIALLDKASHEVDLNPQHLEMVEERLFALRGLARKHNTNVDSLADLLEALRGQLMAVEDGGAALEKMRREEAAARAAFLRAAEKLGQARRKAAKAMDGAVARELAPLKLEKAKFSTLIDTLDEDAWSEGGCEKVAFQVATNPGAPPGPLNKIASGGELARFTLALKVVLAKADPVPSLVFDEVDSGIGGAVADAVGERLSKMASDVQVLVVTHSPQVAARGTHHWQVSKSEAKGIVLTSVDILSEPERQEEIARMLAGAKITDEARAAASSLLQGRGP